MVSGQRVSWPPSRLSKGPLLWSLQTPTYCSLPRCRGLCHLFLALIPHTGLQTNQWYRHNNGIYIAICRNVATVGIRFKIKNTICLFHSLWFLCPNPPILAAISYSNTTCLIFKMITFNQSQQMFTRGAIFFQAKHLFMIGKRIYITLSKCEVNKKINYLGISKRMKQVLWNFLHHLSNYAPYLLTEGSSDLVKVNPTELGSCCWRESLGNTSWLKCEVPGIVLFTVSTSGGINLAVTPVIKQINQQINNGYQPIPLISKISKYIQKHIPWESM